MPFQIAPLATPLQLTNANAALFTATAATQILKWTLANSSAASVAGVTLHLVRSGDAPGTDTIIAPAFSMLALERLDVAELIGQPLAIDDAIWGFAGTTLVINVFAGGLLMS